LDLEREVALVVDAVMFSSASTEWETPQWLYDELDAEFHFVLDAAATKKNTKCGTWLPDGLVGGWAFDAWTWCNPPYGRNSTGKWVEKARDEAYLGCSSVLLLPARTDTRWFHRYIWDKKLGRPREGVEVRFLPGRLKFTGCKDSAPFPSMIVVFHAKES
jgi:phage N-6-adenine-methyltransferase